MRSSLMIFLLGLVLGSTLGIGGLWTQVVQPAYSQIEELETEHGAMEQALAEAGETLEQVAATLRSDVEPVKSGDTAAAPLLFGPAQPGAREATTPLQPTQRKVLAERLDTVVGKLNTARGD